MSERAIAIPAASNFRALHGKGVTGTVDGRAVALGSARLFTELGLELGPLAARAEVLRHPSS